MEYLSHTAHAAPKKITVLDLYVKDNQQKLASTLTSIIRHTIKKPVYGRLVSDVCLFSK